MRSDHGCGDVGSPRYCDHRPSDNARSRPRCHVCTSIRAPTARRHPQRTRQPGGRRCRSRCSLGVPRTSSRAWSSCPPERPWSSSRTARRRPWNRPVTSATSGAVASHAGGSAELTLSTRPMRSGTTPGGRRQRGDERLHEPRPAQDADDPSVVRRGPSPLLRRARRGHAHGLVDRSVRAEDRLAAGRRESRGRPRIHGSADQPPRHRGRLLPLRSPGPYPSCTGSSSTSSRGTSLPFARPNSPDTSARDFCEVIRR